MSAEKKLESLNIILSKPPVPVANYVSYVNIDGFLYVSGQVSKTPDGSLITGVVGKDISTLDAVNAARVCAINILAQVKDALGSLDKVSKVVKLTGFVNSVSEFKDHPTVINGASDLMVDVFGKEIGAHSRSAVGAGSLPLNVSVEIEAIFKIK